MNAHSKCVCSLLDKEHSSSNSSYTFGIMYLSDKLVKGEGETEGEEAEDEG